MALSRSMPLATAARSAVVVLLSALCPFALAQTPAQTATQTTIPKSMPGTGAVLVLDRVTGADAVPGGERIHFAGATMELTALRPDVIRVRVWKGSEQPEDASWAVLPEARAARARTSDLGGDAAGFTTDKLQVTVDRHTGFLRIADRQGNLLNEDLRPIEFHGGEFRLTKRMGEDEHYFGLGDKPGPLDRRGEAFQLWNSDTFGWQESTDPIYKSIPFFLSMRGGRAVGVLMDNTYRSSFDFGKELPDAMSFGSTDGPVDYYVFYGPEPKQVVETYAWLTGTTPLPPLWSLGYQQSRYSYYPQQRVMEIADRLRKDRIPADAIYLDIDYQKDNRPFTVDTARFPAFSQMIADLAKKQFHVVVITDLHIAKLPDQGYAPYDSGTAGDHFVKNPDGSVFSGKVWPGPSVFPDFTQDASRAWWGTLYKQFYAEGIAGFWNDMNEPALFDVPSKTMPDDVQHRIEGSGFRTRTADHLEIHNVFGMENTRGTYEGLLKLKPDQRPFVLTRASYAGGQRYSATWTGDNSSTWNHLRQTTPQLENLGLSGFGMSGADVGGFAGTPQPDLLTKWMEIAAFQPIDRDHTAKGTADQEPWVHGPAQEATRRRFIEERYRLLPYLYTVTEEMSRTGIPIVRPLFLEFPHAAKDGHPIDLDAGGEFLFGPDLLIAPAPYPDELDAYRVQLPPGDWYDYWTGARVDRQANGIEVRDAEQPLADTNQPRHTTKSLQPKRTPGAAGQPAGVAPVAPRKATHTDPLLITPQLTELPVYVRGGAILPRQPLVQNTDQRPQGPLTLRVYAGPDCHGTVYQDDGTSFAYTKGEFLRMDTTCSTEGGAVTVKVGAHQGSFQPWWKELAIEVYGARSGAKATVGGKPVRSSAGPNGSVVVTVPDTGKGAEVMLQ